MKVIFGICIGLCLFMFAIAVDKTDTEPEDAQNYASVGIVAGLIGTIGLVAMHFIKVFSLLP